MKYNNNNNNNNKHQKESQVCRTYTYMYNASALNNGLNSNGDAAITQISPHSIQMWQGYLLAAIGPPVRNGPET